MEKCKKKLLVKKKRGKMNIWKKNKNAG